MTSVSQDPRPPAPSTAPPFAEKQLTVLPPIEVAGRWIKRYHVTSDPAGIAPEVERAAYAILPELLPAPDGTPPAGFVVLHRGDDDGAYLNAYSWVWDNVLHFRGAAAGQPVLDCPDDDPSRFVTTATDRPWIGCVWELPPILHERNAWVRHILTPRAPEVPDLDAYLTDSLPAGTTGVRS
ncbi:hypothetical protein [Streptomyces maremycinicus]|uniref:hypothetical protein n=1 Tax=Streptomyces maremycinicus TaxID=1679753 RepID=UPI00078984F7|nr:hypothetical protein [Streptomyces sp. NBRC 110468]